VKQYWNSVFTTFIDNYSAGLTPNPDILCNRFVKFGYLLQHAKSLGADRLATGHYARLSGGIGSSEGQAITVNFEPKISCTAYISAAGATASTPR
jgi:tRNA-specific 2-thiouridylase